jgi:N-acetylneuraminate synthase
VFVIAEIGINHNGDVGHACDLIRAAARAGADAVKFQKRTPELCVPVGQADRLRETPWGYISYLEYRRRIELSAHEYETIATCCREHNVMFFASVWDEPSVEFMERFSPPCYKIPSAALTDLDLLRTVRSTGRPIILSTGMSTLEQIDAAVSMLELDNLMVLHSTSSYPCDPNELNLTVISALRERFGVPIGYSGHEVGLVTTAVAVALGACVVERHITLDRAMWGSDQAASVEPDGFSKLVKYIRVTSMSLGDGTKQVYPSEASAMARLRRVP